MKEELANQINKIEEEIRNLEKEKIYELLNKDNDLTKKEQIILGELILNCVGNLYKKQIIDLNPSLDAIYICVKTRGGDAIIVNSKKEYLTATSAVNFDKHLQEFINGRRTK